MLIRTITLSFNPVTEQFDEEELQAFIKDKEILTLREHFFINQETPYLVVFLTYRTGRHSVADTVGPKDKESWRKLLSNDQLPLFDTLREWRAELSKQKGIPPYLICTNRQFAQIVNERPQTLASLGKINGLGKAKLEEYGQAILAILQPAEAEKPGPDSSEQAALFKDSQKPDKDTP